MKNTQTLWWRTHKPYDEEHTNRTRQLSFFSESISNHALTGGAVQNYHCVATQTSYRILILLY